MVNEFVYLKIKTDTTTNINCQCGTKICVPSDLQFSTSYVICPKCDHENDSMQNMDNSMNNLNYAPCVTRLCDS